MGAKKGRLTIRQARVVSVTIQRTRVMVGGGKKTHTPITLISLAA